ncbi:hypothetical protein BD779DRAFT_1580774 [Infundibulicybe gibba]|nr:hypothetical protein BD779DRAFT_1580774 [Infundibulicybe gibba]
MTSNKSARTSISRNSKELPLTPVSLAKYIIGHLDLHDTFSFLSVCSGVKRLCHSRFLWLDLLQRTERSWRRLRSIPIVFSKNWGSERPSIRRPVRSKSYGPAGSGVAAILSVVPGTSLAILYIRETTQLICCDLDAPHLMESMVVGHISRKAHYNKPGLHLIALTMGHHGHARSLCVLGVEHENGRAALFICEDVIGVIPYPEDETFIRVHATNFLTNVSVTVLIEVGHPISNFSYLLCYVHDTSPYIVVANSWEFEVHRCPADRLPLGGAHGLESGSHERINNTRVAKIDVEQDGLRADHGVYDSEIAEMRWSPMGFHAIVVEYSHETAYPTTVGSHIKSRDSPWLLASSPSGMYTVIILDRTHDTPCNSDSEPSVFLYLVQFLVNPDAIKTRLLEFPSYICLHEIYSVAVDERRGYLFAIPYA